MITVLAGVFLVLGAIIVWDMNVSKGNKYLAVFFAVFGIFVNIYNGYMYYSDVTEREAKAELLDDMFASGQCNILALEEVNFGLNKLRYKCSDGVEVVETVDNDRFKQLLKQKIKG